VKKILVNLADVSYIDSAGIGALVYGAETAKVWRILKLFNVPKRVKD